MCAAYERHCGLSPLSAGPRAVWVLTRCNDLVGMVFLALILIAGRGCAPRQFGSPWALSFQMKRALRLCLVASVSNAYDVIVDQRLQCMPG